MNNTLTAEESKLIDLVRRLEEDGYDFEVDIAELETAVRAEPIDPLEKFYLRAYNLDDGSLSYALAQAKNYLLYVPIGISMVSFVVAFGITTALLLSGFINFYYLIALLILVNIILLVRSLTFYRHSEGVLPFETFFERLTPQHPVGNHAYDICLEERNFSRYWQALKLIQLQWLMLLLGVVVAFMVSYALRVEAFVLQATAYQGHVKLLADGLNIVPSIFGSRLDNIDYNPHELLYFFLVSLWVYAIIPRLVAGIACFVKAKTDFRLNGRLYYYDELYRKFSHKISDDDDYVPYHAKPKLAQIDPDVQKIVATLHHGAIDETWYRFGAGFKVYDFGVLTNDNLRRLFAVIDLKKSPVYLGVFIDNFPDETTQTLLTALKQRAGYGLAVEIIKVVKDETTHDFYEDWQAVLLDMGIAEVRY